MVLMAAFAALLSRYSGQEDFAIGTPIAGRWSKELQGVVGCFINTLAIRAVVSPSMSFQDLVKRVRGTVLDAFDHKDVPFEQLVAELRAPRESARSPSSR